MKKAVNCTQNSTQQNSITLDWIATYIQNIVADRRETFSISDGFEF